MEEALEEIGAELGVEPRQIIQHIWALPKAQEVEDLRTRIDGLLKKNADLKTQVADWDSKLKEAEALTAAAFEEKIWARRSTRRRLSHLRNSTPSWGLRAMW